MAEQLRNNTKNLLQEYTHVSLAISLLFPALVPQKNGSPL